MTAWLFDVDGVLMDPQLRVADPLILDEIVMKLSSGNCVALVTGRSIDFMRDKVVNPLINKLPELSLLQNFLAVGEKGGAWIAYDKEGKENENIDPKVSIPLDLIEKVRILIRDEFSDMMFFDETKRTMISVEMNEGASVDDYHEKQNMLNQKLLELIKSYEDLEIDPTVIATDIQNKKTGKDLAARHVLAWLREKGQDPSEVITFGDSKGDLAMCQEVYDQGLKCVMVFTGDPKVLEGKDIPFKITYTKNLYEKGTLEFLQNY